MRTLALALLALTGPAALASSADPAPAAAVAAAAPARPAPPAGETGMALSEALSAASRPELLGVFAYVPEKDLPMAFADFLSRDGAALKRYASRLRSDMKAAGGLSGWDHEVCAVLVNFYASPMSSGAARPDAKRMTIVNECVLSPVLPMQEIVSRRNK